MDGFILQIPVTGDEYETVLVSVSSCRVTKRHRLGGLNDRHLCLDNSGGRTSESMCRQGCFLPGPLSWACRWPSSACVFPRFPLCVSVSPSLLLIRTLVISLPAEQARVGVVRNEERGFGGSGGHRQPWPFSWNEVGLLQDFKQRWDVLHLLVKRIPLAALLMMNYRKMY